MYPLGLDMLSDEFYIHLSALLVCVWRIHSHVKNANAPTISAKCIDTHHTMKCVDLANIFRINLPSRTNWVLLNYMELNANSEWMEHSISTYTFTKNESYILINHKRSREICGRSTHFKWTEFCGYHKCCVQLNQFYPWECLNQSPNSMRCTSAAAMGNKNPFRQNYMHKNKL